MQTLTIQAHKPYTGTPPHTHTLLTQYGNNIPATTSLFQIIFSNNIEIMQLSTNSVAEISINVKHSK